MSSVQALSPQFIIYRVVKDRAWGRDLDKKASDTRVSRPIAFAHKDEASTGSSEL